MSTKENKSRKELFKSNMPFPGIWEYYRKMDQKRKKRKKKEE